MGAQSRFIWHDLMTADVESAKRFYGEAFGWRFKGDAKGEYDHIEAGQKGIGGIFKLDASRGVPPHWVGYVTVDDVDATVSKVKQLGGKVHVPKTDIPETGQFAIAADPLGAVFAPFRYTGKGANEPESNAMPEPYTFCWDELLASDPDAAARFYTTLFGWRADSMDMPGFGRYTLLKRPGIKDSDGNDKNAGGLMKSPPGVPVSFWLTYVAVPDTDQLVAKVTRLGAKVTAPPMDIPNVGRFATLLDPQNAALAVLAAKR
jgi:predicted enzyme related to lactoylglutathione lyase